MLFMLQLRRFIKYLFFIFTNLTFAERFYQNILWRKILKQKKPKIVNSVVGDWSDERIRHQIWKKIPEILDVSKDIVYLEFGVFKGMSIKFFSKMYSNKNSKFYGFDTFKGLPEKWNKFEKGTFSTDGKEPSLNDDRIKFIKGLFQDTLSNFLNNFSLESKKKIFLIHFDSDLYSSTLFTLFKIYDHNKDFYFIFDQFGSDECKAFYHFTKATRANYELFFVTHWNHGPQVVFGKLI